MMRVDRPPCGLISSRAALAPLKGTAMTRLLSLALVSCLLTGSVRAEVGCADIGCAEPCASACDSCVGKARCKRGCGLLAHGGWLKRKACGCDCQSAGLGGCEGGCDPCGFSDACGCGGRHGHGCGRGGLRGHGRHCIDGLDRYYNCGCNGSYNYPVPPLYTYHWPGMYKAQRMTDYQSPYRFPPLRPYTEENLVPLLEETPVPGTMTMAPIGQARSQPVSLQTIEFRPATGEVESMSSRLQRINSR